MNFEIGTNRSLSEDQRLDEIFDFVDESMIHARTIEDWQEIDAVVEKVPLDQPLSVLIGWLVITSHGGNKKLPSRLRIFKHLKELHGDRKGLLDNLG